MSAGPRAPVPGFAVGRADGGGAEGYRIGLHPDAPAGAAARRRARHHHEGLAGDGGGYEDGHGIAPAGLGGADGHREPGVGTPRARGRHGVAGGTGGPGLAVHEAGAAGGAVELQAEAVAGGDAHGQHPRGFDGFDGAGGQQEAAVGGGGGQFHGGRPAAAAVGRAHELEGAGGFAEEVDVAAVPEEGRAAEGVRGGEFPGGAFVGGGVDAALHPAAAVVLFLLAGLVLDVGARLVEGDEPLAVRQRQHVRALQGEAGGGGDFAGGCFGGAHGRSPFGRRRRRAT